MFYCEVGKHMTAPGQRCVKFVAERRDREYQNEVVDKQSKRVTGHTKSAGWEIAREGKACEKHAPEFDDASIRR